MDCEPHRGLLRSGPFDPVSRMRGNVEVIPRTEQPRLVLAREQNPCRALDDEDPLGPFLVVEMARRARLTGRDDALDPNIRRREQFDDLLVRELARNVRQDVATGERHSRVLLLRRAARRPDRAPLPYALTVSS